MQLAVAGFGKIGSAITRGALTAGVVQKHQVVVWARSKERQAEAQSFGLALAPWPDVLRLAPNILLALKPQALADMTATHHPIAKDATVISVIAGWTCSALAQRLGVQRVIRAMPSVGASVRASTTAIATTDADATFATQLFSAVGPVVHVPEALIDAATAITSSGVAYACLFIESLQNAAEEMGVSKEAARLLALGAADAAVACLRAGDISAAALRNSVTSPAGTTAAALRVLTDGGFESLIRNAAMAARDRAAELAHVDRSN